VISRFSPETFSKLKNKPQIKSNDTLPGLIDEQGWRDGKELAELQKKNQILKSHLSEREWFLISYKTIGGLTLAEAADKLDISVPTFRKYRDETFEKSRKLLDQISK